MFIQVFGFNVWRVEVISDGLVVGSVCSDVVVPPRVFVRSALNLFSGLGLFSLEKKVTVETFAFFLGLGTNDD